MIKVGIIGGSGYTGGELIRILLQHPGAEIAFVYSTTRAGKALSEVHPDLLGQTSLEFSGEVDPSVDVVFLCLGHGNSKAFLQENPFSPTTKIIDLSNDFRLAADAGLMGRQFVYGLPELHRTEIQGANAVANPGCFATAIELGLLPLAQENLLQEEVHIHAITGSTGAGAGLSPTTHFSWRENNLSWYKPFTHQHLGEISQSLSSLGNAHGKLRLLPLRGNFTRGILATAYTPFSGSLDQARELYADFYHGAAFTQISEVEIHLKQVVNTNQCHLHLHRHEDLLLVTSAVDNLLKGASGQAVHNMNLMFGLPETQGLMLKAGVF